MLNLLNNSFALFVWRNVMQTDKTGHNPFVAEGFKLPSTTHKCCCVAVRVSDRVDIRDTKDLQSPTLTFNKDEWAAFVAGVKNGEFDV